MEIVFPSGGAEIAAVDKETAHDEEAADAVVGRDGKPKMASRQAVEMRQGYGETEHVADSPEVVPELKSWSFRCWIVRHRVDLRDLLPKINHNNNARSYNDIAGVGLALERVPANFTIFVAMKRIFTDTRRAYCPDALLLGLLLLGFLFFTDLLAAVTLWAHGPLGAWIPLAGAGAAIISTAWASGCKGLRLLMSALAGFGFVAIVSLLSAFVYDPSFDTYLYHSDTVVLLAEGWNPLDGPSPTGSLWVTYYPRAAELFQAAMLSLTGNLQATKIVGPILILSTALLSWKALEASCAERISSLERVVCVAVAICNPLVLGQFLSMYVDYILWLAMLLLISGFILVYRHPERRGGYVILFMSVAFGLNVKITHFFYLGLTALFLAGWCVADKKYRLLGRCTVTVLGAVAVGVCLIGYNPILTNVLDHGCPYYPLNQESVDIMTSNTPEMFSDGTVVGNFLKSLLSTSDTPWGILRGNPALSASLSPLLGTYSRVANVNGFGFLMMPMLLVGVALMAVARPAFRWWVAYLTAFLFCWIFDQSWWARYIPFLWMAVLLPLVLSYLARIALRRRRWWNNALRRLLIALVGLSSLLWIASGSFTFARYSIFIDYIVERQSQTGRPVEVANLTPTSRRQLRERGVEYVEVEIPAADDDNAQGMEDPGDWFRFFGMDYFPTAIRLPEADYPEAHDPALRFPLKLADFPSRRFNPNDFQPQ